MEGITTLDGALGFFAGATFIGGTMWTFIVMPLKKERDALANKYEQKLLGDISRLHDFINRDKGGAGV